MKYHYKKLFKKEEFHRDNEIDSYIEQLEKEEGDPNLDKEITRDEIIKAINSLKNGKASGNDGIVPEMIKECKDILIQPIQKIFNDIFNEGTFPKSWKLGEITSIYKKQGSKFEASNYRGITVTSTLSKLFCKILNNRLESHSSNNGIIPVEQIGFAKNMRTTDHLLTLNAVTEKYINNTNNGKLYACFVDFQKAFDKVPHNMLLFKLLKNGVNGKMYRIIKNMYHEAESKVKGTPNCDKFKIEQGVHQGNILSPLLYKIFLYDLPGIFNNNKEICDPIELGNKIFSCLLYADDLVIFSKSSDGLQNCLNLLNNFCTENNIKVNIKKTKAMTFNKGGRIINSKSYLLGEKELENTNEYKYLGLMIKSNGKFNLAMEDLKARALKASHTVRKNIPNNCNLQTQLKLYNSLIKPIVTYGAELWYPVYLNNINIMDFPEEYAKFDNCTELFQIKHIKSILGVNYKASNVAVMSEVGAYPLYIDAMRKAFGYWVHLTQLPNTSIVKNAYNELYELDRRGKNNWITSVKSLITSIGDINLNFAWENQGARNWSKSKIEKLSIKIESKLKENYKVKIMGMIKNPNAINRKENDKWEKKNKLRTYAIFKKEYKLEEYLQTNMNIKHRKMMTKLRISSHDLSIEVGRRYNIPPENRICNVCNYGVEDEYHFLFSCRALNKVRIQYLDRLNIKRNEDGIFEKETSLQKLFMYNENQKFYRLVGEFCFKLFELREKTLIDKKGPCSEIIIKANLSRYCMF